MKRKAVFSLLIAGLFVQSAFAQPRVISILKKQLASLPADTNKVNLLHHLSYEYYAWGGDPEQMKGYAEQCLKLASELHYPYGIALGYNAIGRYYLKKNRNKEALHYFERALNSYRQAGRKLGLAVIYRSIGMVNEDMGNSSKSMEFYMKSIRIGEEIGNQEILSNTFQSIGILMLNQQKYEDALCYLFDALRFHQRLKDDRARAITLNSIGLAYQEKKQYAKATHYLYLSLRLSDLLGLEQVKTGCYNNLGTVLFFQRDYEKAFEYFRKAMILSEPQGYHKAMCIALDGMARIYLKKANPVKAVAYYQESLRIAESWQLAKQKIEAHEGLMASFAQSKDFPKAFFHQSRAMALKDSTFTAENDHRIAQLEAAYEVEKKQAEIGLLQKDQERGNLIRNAILAGLLLSLIIIALIINRQRLKNRQSALILSKSQEIAGKNAQLETQAQVMAAQASELALSNKQLEAQTKQLLKVNQIKSNFFANISHEFRTPLTLILAPLEKLLTGTLKIEQTQSYYHLIERNARYLLELINQLLDYAKVEDGSLKVKLVRGDVNQRIKATAFSFFSLAESKGIHLHFNSNYQNIYALFDTDLLDKILNNLLSNAFKFTPQGGHVTVGISLEHNQKTFQENISLGNQILQIQVSDTGIGIPEKQLDHIFDRFFQISGTENNERQGTGIGLALVNELVNLHQGTISVASELGSGSRFTVQIPLAECSFEMKDSLDQPKIESGCAWFKGTENMPLQNLATQTEQNEQYPLLLMVEDSAEVREFIGSSFQDSFRVMEACNGLEGFEIAQKEIPDIIITDRMMPVIDGVEFCRQLKSDERTSHIPVIMLTAKASEASRIEGLETGADDYILKPFSLQELRVRAKNLIGQRRQLRERFTRDVRLQPKDIAITSADEVFLTKAIGIIEEHMADTDFSVETFVCEIAMSRVQVHRKLKALTDQSTTEFIRSIRLKRAASLLENHYGNIAEVMYEVGFNNVSYFASNFKKMFGVNPSEYHPYAAAQAGRASFNSK